jgi:cobalt-zinc-cadmium efflux system outer membrane protein
MQYVFKREPALVACYFWAILFFASITSTAQTKDADTMLLSLPSMEKIFLDSNLTLLAGHYGVDAQKAFIQQAKVWDNPMLNTDQVIAANGKIFPYGKNPDGSYSGQYYIQIQQLIKTAGKRGKLVNLATTNAKLSELQLQDVLRNLRYLLRSDYYNIQQQLGAKWIYETQEIQLKKLLSGMDAQLSAGNIAQKDYLRIQALLIALEQDITELNKDLEDNQRDLKVLLQIKNADFIKPIDNANSNPLNLINAEIIFDTARKSNPNYLLQQTQTVYQQQNLSYQRSLRTPDLTVSPNFDRNSNFAPNYFGLGLSIPLPIINNNKGNIKSAEFSIKQQQTITASVETELWNNINSAYQKLLLTIKQNSRNQKEFYQKYEAMYQNVLMSYQSKQISLLEFLDFFNDYTASQQRLLQQHLNLQLAKEELNYHTGVDILK